MQRIAVVVTAAFALVTLAPAAVSDSSAAPGGRCTKAKEHRVVKGKHRCLAVPKKARPKPPVAVQLLGVNDFHGNLQPPSGSSGRVVTSIAANGAPVQTDTGGAEYLATHVQRLRAASPRNTLFVSAGDMIGASPLLSGLFHDEATVEAFGAMGLAFNGVGNHEFDEGVPELLRMQNGGCHPVDGCQDGDPFPGAAFGYLSANVYVDTARRRTLLPPYAVRTVGGVRIGVIGLPTDTTPTVVTPAGVVGLSFVDEVETINRYAAVLKRQGVRTIVVLLHEGGQQNGAGQTIDTCESLSGPVSEIVPRLDSEVDVVMSAHTHQAYNCRIGNVLVTSAASFGRVITRVRLRISRASGNVVSGRATNVPVTRDVPRDAGLTALMAKYDRVAAPIANRVVGRITADITRAGNAAGESALGDVIADAQLAATAPSGFGGSVVAFMNPGGIRTDLVAGQSAGGEAPGEVTYGEVFAVQPFANTLIVKTCTGAQIKALLEQQFDNPNVGADRILQVSRGSTYAYNRSAPAGSRVDAAAIKISGVTVDPAASYRVTMNSFLATGGDNFTVFAQCTSPLGGEVDVDALVRYLGANSPVPPGPQNRITRTG